MLKSFNFRNFPSQFIACLQVVRDTIPFIKQNKLWKGFFDHKWVLFVTLVIAVFFSLIVYGNLNAILTPEVDQVMQSSLSPEMLDVVDDAKEISKKGAFTSGTKYLLLILLEVVIFHFSVKTLSILSNSKKVASLKDFIKAEKRMIKIMVINFVKGLIVSAFLYVALSTIDMEFATATIMFFVYAYFIGYAFLDNYNEQFVKTIKNSQSIIRKHVGAATALGVVITLMMYIPVIGPFFAPIFGGIAGAIYGERFKIENELIGIGEVDESISMV